MIAKSDLIILVVSASALALGVVRWQQGISAPELAAAPPAQSQGVQQANQPTASNTLSRDPATAVVGSLAGSSEASVVAADTAAVRVRRTDAGKLPNGSTPDATTTAGTSPNATAPDQSVNPAVVVTAVESQNGGDALYGTYRIRSGDFLGKLAARFGTSVETLQSINKLDGTVIHVGDPLLYPLPAN